MTTIIGYGEDALTFWALSQRMADILRQLADDTPPADAVVFYRPSCGRGEGGDVDALRSLFGEFDAIIGTAAGVYLLEAKWHRSSGVRGGRVKLDEVQLRRHDIFGTYLRLWREVCAGERTSWDRFALAARDTFEAAHDGWRLVHSETSTRNVGFVLERLRKCGEEVRNVLLFFGPVGAPAPTYAPAGFTLVALEYEPLAGGEFVDTLVAV
jgi:hypothetical protein